MSSVEEQVLSLEDADFRFKDNCVLDISSQELFSLYRVTSPSGSVLGYTGYHHNYNRSHEIHQQLTSLTLEGIKEEILQILREESFEYAVGT